MKVYKGDRVKVLRASTPDERPLWNDSWTSEMNEFVGKWCIALNSSYYNKCSLYMEGEDTCDSWQFPTFVLQKEIPIGKQLLFPFMEE